MPRPVMQSVGRLTSRVIGKDMKQTFEPIETSVGIISGRDAFFLDDISFDYQNSIIRLAGEINGHLCSHNEKNLDYIAYSLVFSGILGFRMIELDFSGFPGTSSFDRVINSEWLYEMRRSDSAAKIKPEHEHYTLMTYDDVFDVVCSAYELTLNA
jgi:hypothetical protein